MPSDVEFEINDVVEVVEAGISQGKAVVLRAHPDGSYTVKHLKTEEEERHPSRELVLVKSASASSISHFGPEPTGKDMNGKRLTKGDKITAKFKGKGTKFYPGVIAEVKMGPHEIPLFDIKYDDGDLESGASGSNIKKTEPEAARGLLSIAEGAPYGDKDGNKRPVGFTFTDVSRSETPTLEPVDCSGNKLAVGDRVEAKYKGKGVRWYPGKIAKIHEGIGGIVTFAIAYEDGDREDGALSSNIRKIQPTRVDMARSEAENSSSKSGSTTPRASSPRPMVTKEMPAVSAPVVNDTDGRPLAVGDRVEARYKGKGSRWYPAKIVKITGDGTVSIAYDDGDKEDGALGINIRRVGPSAAAEDTDLTDIKKPSPFIFGARSDSVEKAPLWQPKDSQGKVLAVGDAVEAKFKGKGTRFYPGKIAKINDEGNGRFAISILYDDGDKEEGARGIHIRRLGPDGMATPSSKPVGAAKDDSGSVSAKPSRSSGADGFMSLSKGSSGADEPGKHLDSNGKPLAVGVKVEARYKGKGTRWYSGKITKIAESASGNVTYSIDYDDGDKEEGALGSSIRRIGPIPEATPADEPSATAHADAADSVKPRTVVPAADAGRPHGAAPRAKDTDGKGVAVGDKVETRYKGRGTRWYPGRVSKISEGPGGSVTFSIAYDDGDKEDGAQPENVRRIGPSKADDGDDANPKPIPSSAPAGDIDTEPATAAAESASKSGKFETSRVTPTEPESRPRGYDGQGKTLVTGDKVEAKYKGRGTKWYAGVISGVRVAADGKVLFNILYDDGDKEADALSANIRRVGPSRDENNLGEAIGVKPAVEMAAAKRSAEELQASSSAPAQEDAKKRTPEADEKPIVKDADGNSLAVGDIVEARYKGKGVKWYPGKITGVKVINGVGVFRLAYDDGDAEDGALGANIRKKKTEPVDAPVPSSSHVEAAASPRATSPVQPPAKKEAKDADGKPLAVGDKVEARYKGRGTKRYPGKITKIDYGGDGVTQYGIAYDDGDKEDGALPANVYKLEEKPREAMEPATTQEAPVEVVKAAAVEEVATVKDVNKPSPKRPGSPPAPQRAEGERRQPKKEGDEPADSSQQAKGRSKPSYSGGDWSEEDRREDSRHRRSGQRESGQRRRGRRRDGYSDSEDDYDDDEGGKGRAGHSDRSRARSSRDGTSAHPRSPSPSRRRDDSLSDTERPRRLSVEGQRRSGASRPEEIASYAKPPSDAFAGTPAQAPVGLGALPLLPISSFGRLCRELAAVRARARPLLFDAYISQARAKAQAADPYFSGTLVPAPRDVEQWLLGNMRRTAEGADDQLYRRDPDVVGTMTVKEGLRASGYAISRDALAVLRSGFRLRDEYASELPFPNANGPSVARLIGTLRKAVDSSENHAAILICPLSLFLASDENTASSMLYQIDDFARRRSGRNRPPAALGGVAPNFVAVHSAPFIPSSPARYDYHGATGYNTMGTMSASYYGNGYPPGLLTPSRIGAATLPSASPKSAPVSHNVGDFLRTQATQMERDNLMTLLSSVADLQQRLGVPQPHGLGSTYASGGGISEGADSLVLNLGPHLRVGMRFYVG